ncbi:hypothetical protein BC829DRAFT_402803 [Chytridium lagenaria]|nr:hypothetical protein BC829DRAFT_402803 [Chytridium lagenaria]
MSTTFRDPLPPIASTSTAEEKQPRLINSPQATPVRSSVPSSLFASQTPTSLLLSQSMTNSMSLTSSPDMLGTIFHPSREIKTPGRRRPVHIVTDPQDSPFRVPSQSSENDAITFNQPLEMPYHKYHTYRDVKSPVTKQRIPIDTQDSPFRDPARRDTAQTPTRDSITTKFSALFNDTQRPSSLPLPISSAKRALFRPTSKIWEDPDVEKNYIIPGPPTGPVHISPQQVNASEENLGPSVALQTRKPLQNRPRRHLGEVPVDFFEEYKLILKEEGKCGGKAVEGSTSTSVELTPNSQMVERTPTKRSKLNPVQERLVDNQRRADAVRKGGPASLRLFGSTKSARNPGVSPGGSSLKN